MDQPSAPSEGPPPSKRRGRQGIPGRPGRPDAERQTRLRDRLASPNLASAIYGQILVLSLLAALGGHHPTAATVLTTVVGSQLVFWLGHAYSEIVAQQVRGGAPSGWREVPGVLEHEWPLVQAAFPTAVLMVLALVGVMETSTALDIAIGLSILQLLGWGYVVGRRSGRSPLGQFAIAAFSGAFGLVIVLLKALAH